MENIEAVENAIDNIWECMNLADFKKGNDNILELIEKIEFIINNYKGKSENLNQIIYSLNKTMKAMEKAEYILEADILKYELKEDVGKLKTEL